MISFVRSILFPLVSHPFSNQFIIQLQSICGVQKDGNIRKDYIIYQIIYLFFKIASAMGEEMFLCIPLLFWFMFPLAITFITQFVIILLSGQLLKDILQLPRPFDKRIVKLEQHFETEFGMPSTHTLTGFLPLSILFKCQRHGMILPAYYFYLNIAYITVISLSRLYMGVHSLMDIIGGLVLGTCFIQLLSIYGDVIDSYLYFHPKTGIYITITLTILFSTLYPRMIPWRASYGTSALIFGAWLGASLGLYVVLICQPSVGHILYSSSFFQYNIISNHINDISVDSIKDESTLVSILNLAKLNNLALNFRIPRINIRGVSHGVYDIMTNVACKVIIGLVVLLFAKCIVKATATYICKFLYNYGILKRHTGEETDAHGRTVPLEKAYCIEIPVRVLAYASISFSVIYITPLSWRMTGLV